MLLKKLSNNMLKKTRKDELIDLLKSLYNNLSDSNKEKLQRTMVESENLPKDDIINGIEWCYDLISEQAKEELAKGQPLETKLKKPLFKKQNNTTKPIERVEKVETTPDRTKLVPPNRNVLQKLQGDDIVKLVGYRYTYPEFPIEYTNSILNSRCVARPDINTIEEIAQAMVEAEEKGHLIQIHTYVPKFDIRDNGLYDEYGVHDESLTTVLADYEGSFPHDLDIQHIAYVDEEGGKVFTTISYYTHVPFTYTRRGFENCDELNCRASKFDYQIYEVIPNDLEA